MIDQLSSACEKRETTGAARIQFHGTTPNDVGMKCAGAYNYQLMDKDDIWNGSDGSQWRGLATSNSSHGMEQLWKACAAVMEYVHMDFLDGLYIMVDDAILSYDNINYAELVAAWIAKLCNFMDEFFELMTAKRAWCCWIFSLVACLVSSRLGLWRTKSSTTRKEKKLARTR